MCWDQHRWRTPVTLDVTDDSPGSLKYPNELESMPTDIHLANKPVGLSMNLSKTKVMLNENATSRPRVPYGNTIAK